MAEGKAVSSEQGIRTITGRARLASNHHPSNWATRVDTRRIRQAEDEQGQEQRGCERVLEVRCHAQSE
jgi:hypothetical protein